MPSRWQRRHSQRQPRAAAAGAAGAAAAAQRRRRRLQQQRPQIAAAAQARSSGLISRGAARRPVLCARQGALVLGGCALTLNLSDAGAVCFLFLSPGFARELAAKPSQRRGALETLTAPLARPAAVLQGRRVPRVPRRRQLRLNAPVRGPARELSSSPVGEPLAPTPLTGAASTQRLSLRGPTGSPARRGTHARQRCAWGRLCRRPRGWSAAFHGTPAPLVFPLRKVTALACAHLSLLLAISLLLQRVHYSRQWQAAARGSVAGQGPRPVPGCQGRGAGRAPPSSR
jgi:hypothetical protein